MCTNANTYVHMQVNLHAVIIIKCEKLMHIKHMKWMSIRTQAYP